MTNTVQLQAVGHVAAKPAGELEIGNRTVWNFGYICEVLSIEPKGKASVLVTLKTEGSGHVGQKLMRKTRLVAITRAL